MLGDVATDACSLLACGADDIAVFHSILIFSSGTSLVTAFLVSGIVICLYGEMVISDRN